MASERTEVVAPQVAELQEELSRCQADKEFVWSLWKRLQVSSPDLTKAVSLVVERCAIKKKERNRY